jgi:hypothetical protein
MDSARTLTTNFRQSPRPGRATSDEKQLNKELTDSLAVLPCVEAVVSEAACDYDDFDLGIKHLSERLNRKLEKGGQKKAISRITALFFRATTLGWFGDHNWTYPPIPVMDRENWTT